MKKALYFAFAAAICAVSCTVIDETVNPSEDAVCYVGASINAVDSKTSLGDKDGSTYPIEWQAGDQIVVNGVQSLALTAADITDGTSATFGFESTLSGTLSAVSPASAFVTNGVVNLPQNQVYTEGSYDPAAAILFGTGTGTINMTAAVAFLKFDVKAKDGVKKIQVGGLAREALAGMFNTDYATLTPKTGSTAGFVNVSSETPITEGSMIIAIPAQTYAKGLMLMITDGKDNTINKKSTAEFTAEAGKMYSTDLDLDPAAPAIMFAPSSAANAATVSIDHSKGLYDDALSLTWVADIVGATYTVSMSLAEDMSNPVVAASGTSTTLKLDNKTLNSLMSKLGKEYSKSVTVYYQVSASGDAVAPSEVRNVVISTEFGSYTDARDNEVYPVTKVGSKYWMAENMRAVKYSDGTALEAIAGYDFIPYTDGYLGKRAGVYYTYPHAARGNFEGAWFDPIPGSTDQIQGICPDGWHLANNADFTAAAQAAASALGTTYNGDVFAENYWPELASAFRFGGDYPYTAEGYDYNNELGLYFVPSHYYAPNSDRSAAPADYGYEVLIWSSTMVSAWDAYAFQCNHWNNLVFASHYGSHPVGGWAAQLPARCVKDY